MARTKNQPKSTPNEHLLRNSFVIAVALLFVLFSYLPSPVSTETASAQTAPPWVTNFTPLRTRYVTPNGGGSQNGTIGNPISFATAVSTYQCGDLHILREGNYLNTFALHSEFNRTCTSGNPAVWKAFVSSTGQPENAKFRPQIQQPRAWNWFVNIHCDGEKTANPDTSLGCFRFDHSGTRLINSVVHDSTSPPVRWYSTAPGSASPGMVIYGSVIYGAGGGPGGGGTPNVYTQNIYEISGLKYFVHNMSLQPQVEGKVFFQANDSGGDEGLGGYWLEGNLFGDMSPGPPEKSGSTVIWTQSCSGCTKNPNPAVTLKDNYFVDFYHNNSLYESIRFGNGTAIQANVTGNYLAKTNFHYLGYWGNSGTHDPIVFTGNEIYDPPNGVHLSLATVNEAVTSTGVLKINNADVWNNNTYGGTFKASNLRCNGGQSTNLTLTQWRTNTNNCRVTPGSAGFDLNSTVVANPTVNKIEVVPNQYQCSSGCPFTDSAWGNIYAVNWQNSSSITVNISSVVAPGKFYVVRYPRDFYGTPAASGTCPSSGACNVSLPTRRTFGSQRPVHQCLRHHCPA